LEALYLLQGAGKAEGAGAEADGAAAGTEAGRRAMTEADAT